MVRLTAAILAVFFGVLTLGACSGGADPSGGNPPPQAGAPSGLAATAITSASVTLAWRGSGQFTRYRIFRNDVEIATTTTETYADSALSPVTPYRYFVRGESPAGLSGPSNTIAVTTPNMLRLSFARLIDEAARSYMMVRDIAFDGAGNIFIAGGAFSANFPTTAGAYDRTLGGGGSSAGTSGPSDAFVMKLSPSGSVLWSTLLGGPNYDRAYGLEIAPDGGVVIAGRAGEGFPTTTGVLQPAFAGDSAPVSLYGKQDGFIAKLSADGSRLLWSTYFGDATSGFLRDVAVGSDNKIHVAGAFQSGLAHITPDAAQAAVRGAHDLVYARLSANAGGLDYGTYLGGTEPAGATPGTPSIAVSPSREVFVAIEEGGSGAPTTAGALQRSNAGGVDFLIAKFTASGQLAYATYLGGSADEDLETHNIAVDSAGRLAIAAVTASANYPTTALAFQPQFGGGVLDGAISILSADGSALVASTFLGAGGREDLQGVAFSPDGLLYVSGGSRSTALRTTSNAFQTNFAGVEDAFLAGFTADLKGVPFLSYAGGSDEDISRALAIAGNGKIAIAGHTASHNFPVSAGGSTAPNGVYTGWLSSLTP